MRPKNPYVEANWSVMKYDIFEEGVNATLEALRAEGVHCVFYSGFFHSASGDSGNAIWELQEKCNKIKTGTKGVLNFIPDEVEA